MHLDFSTMEYDTTYELVKAAVHFEIVKTGGGGYYTLPDGTKIQGKSKLRQKIKEDGELAMKIADVMMDRAG